MIAILCLSAALLVQDPPADKMPGFAPTPKVAQPTLLASDGEPVQPGRIPAGTTEAARKLWDRLFAFSTGGQTVAPVRAFDLRFDVRLRDEGRNNNLGEVAYRFKTPENWLRCWIKRSGRVQVRGPEGDFLAEDGRTIELRGREHKQSTREMDEWVGIARNFLALSNPAEARLVRLESTTQPELSWPKPLLPALPALEWLEIHSPDFRLYVAAPRSGTGQPEKVFKALIGLDSTTGQPRLALLGEGAQSGWNSESTLLIDLASWTQLGPYRVPEQIGMHTVDLRKRPFGFEDRPRTDLYLFEGGILNPDLTATDFTLGARSARERGR